MSSPIGSVNVQITGTVAGLIDAMGQSVEAVGSASEQMQESLNATARTSTEATATIKRNAEEGASAFEGMSHRFEHSGVLIAFAVQNMLDGQQTGIQRALHSIALLGFAFGPVVGSVATGAALVIEHIHNLAHAAEKEVEEFQKKMAEAVNSGDVAALMKQMQMLQTGVATDASGNINAPSALVKGAVKGSLEDLRAELAALKNAPSPWEAGFTNVTAYDYAIQQLEKSIEPLAAKEKALQAEITAAGVMLEQQARMGQLGKVTISADSDKKTAADKAKAAREALTLKLALDKIGLEADKQFSEEEKKLLDKTMNATFGALHKKIEAEDHADKEWYEVAKSAQDFMEKEAARSAERTAADQKHAAAEVANEWKQAFRSVETAVESAYNKTKEHGGNFRDFMRNAGRQILEDELRNELRIQEARLARIISGQTAEEIGKEKSLAISAAASLAKITNDAKTAASGAFSAEASIPYVGPELGAAAAAAAGASVMALAAGIVSAAGGFDIPAGLNPVTQLHEREMVLPAHLADRVRGITDGGGSGGHVHIHATDSIEVSRWATRNGNGGALHRGVTEHLRNGGAVPGQVGRRAP